MYIGGLDRYDPGIRILLATLVFDFDSTLIRCETLEELVADQLAGQPEQAERYREMTARGMAGGWSFHESLVRRLSLAAPDLRQAEAFGAGASRLWTAGVPELVADLLSEGHHVWIVSGAPVEVLLAAGRHLGIEADRIRGVRLAWGAEGRGASVDPDDPFSHSKVEGLAHETESWPRPRIMVGDGRTDRAVYEAGLVDAFIPFTVHVRRTEILSDDTPEANSVERLRELIEHYL